MYDRWVYTSNSTTKKICMGSIREKNNKSGDNPAKSSFSWDNFNMDEFFKETDRIGEIIREEKKKARIESSNEDE